MCNIIWQGSDYSKNNTLRSKTLGCPSPLRKEESKEALPACWVFCGRTIKVDHVSGTGCGTGDVKTKDTWSQSQRTHELMENTLWKHNLSPPPSVLSSHHVLANAGLGPELGDALALITCHPSRNSLGRWGLHAILLTWWHSCPQNTVIYHHFYP